MSEEVLSEWGIIGQIKALRAAQVPENITGIGDDCAVIPQENGRAWVVTADALVEENHFLIDKITPNQLGYKSVVANVSDVISMGAQPKYLFLTVAFPKSLKKAWVDAFLQGINEACQQYGVVILGGDTTSGSSVFISITVIGEAEQAHIKYRHGARVGDVLAVTAQLGASKLGLEHLLAGKEHPCIEKHLRPEPNLQAGLWLGKQPAVHAMMDISDGLADDLEKMLQASKLGAIIELTQIPAYGDPKDALISGEEYALLLAIDPQHFPQLQQSAPFSLYPIGNTTAASPIKYTQNAQNINLSLKKYAHF